MADFFFFFLSDVLVDSAELDEVIVWSPELLPLAPSEVYDSRTTRGRENFSRNCSASNGSEVDSLLSLDPLLSPVEQSPPDEREFSLYRCRCLSRAALSISFLRARRAFSNSATENMLALVSCELNRLNLGLWPSRPDDDTIASGRLVCELKVDAIELLLIKLVPSGGGLLLLAMFILWPIFARKNIGFCLNLPFLPSCCCSCFCCCGVGFGM